MRTFRYSSNFKNSDYDMTVEGAFTPENWKEVFKMGIDLVAELRGKYFRSLRPHEDMLDEATVQNNWNSFYGRFKNWTDGIRRSDVKTYYGEVDLDEQEGEAMLADGKPRAIKVTSSLEFVISLVDEVMLITIIVSPHRFRHDLQNIKNIRNFFRETGIYH